MRGPRGGQPGARSRRGGVALNHCKEAKEAPARSAPQRPLMPAHEQARLPRRQLNKSQELHLAPRCAEVSCAPGGVWHLVSRRGVITDSKPNRKDSNVRQETRLRAE